MCYGLRRIKKSNDGEINRQNISSQVFRQSKFNEVQESMLHNFAKILFCYDEQSCSWLVYSETILKNRIHLLLYLITCSIFTSVNSVLQIGYEF